MPQVPLVGSVHAVSAVVELTPGQALPQRPQSVGVESAAAEGCSLQPAGALSEQLASGLGSGASQGPNVPFMHVRCPVQVPDGLVREQACVVEPLQAPPLVGAHRLLIGRHSWRKPSPSITVEQL